MRTIIDLFLELNEWSNLYNVRSIESLFPTYGLLLNILIKKGSSQKDNYLKYWRVAGRPVFLIAVFAKQWTERTAPRAWRKAKRAMTQITPMMDLYFTFKFCNYQGQWWRKKKKEGLFINLSSYHDSHMFARTPHSCNSISRSRSLKFLLTFW